MRSRPMIPPHLLFRLLMVAILLVGAGIPGSSAMAASGVATQEAVSPTEVRQHHCCEPTTAEAACAATCSAVTCATPILPGLDAAPFVSRDAAATPPTARALRSQGPELETPPPRA